MRITRGGLLKSSDANTTYAQLSGVIPAVSIKSYGAKGDGKTVTDAAITSGQATLTSAQAAFTPADAGKTVYVNGAGAANGSLITTILSVAAGVATLATTAGTTVTGQDATFGTDDTAALTAWLTAVASTGGDLFVPDGTYMLAGAQQAGTVQGVGVVAAYSWTYTGQVVFPANPVTAPQRTYKITGQTTAPLLQWGGSQPMPVHQTGAIFFSTATSGNVFDVRPDPGGENYDINASFSNIHVMFDKITVRAPNNPQCGGVNLSTAGAATTQRLLVDVNCRNDRIKQPTGSGYALQMPHIGNSAFAKVSATYGIGFPTALYSGEHTVMDDCGAQMCMTAWRVGAAQHSAVFDRFLYQDCPTGIVGDNTATPIYGHIDHQESHTAQWYDTVYTIDDASNVLRGALTYNNSNGDSLAVRGCLNLNLQNVKGNGWYRSSNLSETFARGGSDRSYALGSADKSAHPWSAVPGLPTFGTTGSKGYVPFVSSQSAAATTKLSIDSFVVRANITTSAAWTDAGILANIGASGTWFLAELKLTSGVNTVSLIKTIGGVKTTVATNAAAGLTASTAYDLEIRRTPYTVALYLNGVQIGSTYTLTSGERTTFAPTSVGLWTFQQSGGAGDDGGTRWNSIGSLPYVA